jgi:hypothetical protein
MFMKKAVFGLATNEDQTNRILDRLLASGFSNQDISVLSPDKNQRSTVTNAYGDVAYTESQTKTKGNLTTEKHTKAPEGGTAGAVAGGVIGGSLGLLAGIGALAIPGLGPFIAAGPIVAALSGSAVGGSVGLVIGALIGSGISEYEAKKYEAALKAGNTLISVHTDTDAEIKRAEEIMKKEGAKDISTSREKTKISH